MHIKNALPLSLIVLFLTFQTNCLAASQQEIASGDTVASDNQVDEFKIR